MTRRQRTLVAALFILAWLPTVIYAGDSPKPPDWPEILATAKAFLLAKSSDEKEARGKLVRLVKEDVVLLADALRELPPLTEFAPGHEGTVKVDVGQDEVSVRLRLPAGYDGLVRFPLLIETRNTRKLPPHETVRDWVIAEMSLDPSKPEQLAGVLRHLKLHLRIDPDRVCLFGDDKAISLAACFPDDFATVVADTPWSTQSGPRRNAELFPNLTGARLRILEYQGEPERFAKAEAFVKEIQEAGGDVGVVGYTDADFGPTESRSSQVHHAPRDLPFVRLGTLAERRTAPSPEWHVPPHRSLSRSATVR